MYLNARSLLNKTTLQLKYHISANNPDMVGITETSVTPENPNDFYSPTGYKLHRVDRFCKRDDGVIFYITESVAPYWSCLIILMILNAYVVNYI